MKPIDSYKRQKPEGNYDAIIIGSGIGGLTAAAIMAKHDKRVLVLEKHYTAGGYTHVFKRRGYEWDVGVHYIGEVHRPHHLLAKLFDYISDGQLEWADLGEVYDKIIFGDEIYEFRKGKAQFAAGLKEKFPDPDDQRAIDDYIDLVYKAQRGSQLFFAERALPPLVGKLAGKAMRKGMMQFAERTTMEVLTSITNNPKLVGVLCGQYGDYGMSPSESSFAIHAGVVKHFIHGGNYPVGGSSRFADTIAAVIAQTGGAVLTNAGVKQILVENNKATGVLMEDGDTYTAPIIISCAGVFNTYGSLLPPDVARQHKFGEKLQNVRPSAAHVCLYVGIKESTEKLGLRKANYWIYPDNYDHDANLKNFLANPAKELPVVYVSFPSAKDPSWEERYPGRTTIDIITVVPYQWFAKWEDTKWMKRPAEYEALKADLSERMLEKLFKFEPQLRGKIDHAELSTPLSTKHFCNYQHGEIYGLDHGPKRYEQTFLRAHTPIKNLFLTGQDIVSCGVGGAAAAGMLTASAILKKNAVKIIQTAKV